MALERKRHALTCYAIYILGRALLHLLFFFFPFPFPFPSYLMQQPRCSPHSFPCERQKKEGQPNETKGAYSSFYILYLSFPFSSKLA